MISYALKASKKLVKSVVGPWQHASYGAYARTGNRVDQMQVHDAPDAGEVAGEAAGTLYKELNGRDAPVRELRAQEDLSGELEVEGFLDTLAKPEHLEEVRK